MADNPVVHLDKETNADQAPALAQAWLLRTCRVIVCVEHFLRKTDISVGSRNGVGESCGSASPATLRGLTVANRRPPVKAGRWPHLCPENQSPRSHPQPCAHVLTTAGAGPYSASPGTFPGSPLYGWPCGRPGLLCLALLSLKSWGK